MSTVMRTFGGRLIDLSRLSVQDIDVKDIAHALGHINRWKGHTKEPISVAQHSHECSRFGGTPEIQMGLLLHDAHEYVLHDTARPEFELMVQVVQKVAGETAADLFRAEWKALVKRVDKTICEALRVPYDWPDEMYDIDDRMLLTEARQQFGVLPVEASVLWPGLGHLKPLNCDVRGWPPGVASDRWYNRFVELHQLIAR